jgi:hypothetical protein
MTMNQHITFHRDEDGIKMLAIFIAQLVKEGVTYTINNAENYVEVTLTGGY